MSMKGIVSEGKMGTRAMREQTMPSIQAGVIESLRNR